jgi:hypothetical protein
MANNRSHAESEGTPASSAYALPGLEPLIAAWTSWAEGFLVASEKALNANPLHDVIPIDWAEIARALRTVWLHQLSRPETAITAAAELNLKLFQSTFDIWTEAAQRWCGMATSSAAGGEPASGGDKRFTAPEWHHNPFYRTLKEFYLLASAWVLHQPAGFGDMTEAERQRLDFHLRQFVDAVSPTLVPLFKSGGCAPGAGDRRGESRGRGPQPDARYRQGPAEYGRY